MPKIIFNSLDVELEFPYERYIQSIDHPDDEAYFEPLEEVENLPEIARKSGNSQSLDDYEGQNPKRKRENFLSNLITTTS